MKREDKADHSPRDTHGGRAADTSGAARVLLLPGWLDSDAPHWQSHWEREHGDLRVTQSDWLWPRRGDWMARLDEVLQDLASPSEPSPPVVLVAHSLGCHLVAAWASHSAHTARVQGALLVAPPDLEREDMPPNLTTWRPIHRQHLPFASIAVVSRNDPYSSIERAQDLALQWGACCLDIGEVGHINGESGLGAWPLGRDLVRSLMHPAARVVDELPDVHESA